MSDTPQAASPVTSPRSSTAAAVFSQVKSTTNDWLDHTLQSFNRTPNFIAASRATLPQAAISNDMVAAVNEYSPQPGLQPARHMRLDLQNNPGPQVDQIIDAIQRYLNIEPRREPTADPLAEASIARHPQQITSAAQRWAAERDYQFASNGAESYQFGPDYRAWGGRLDLTLQNPGTANIFAPATRSPQPARPPQSAPGSTLGQYFTYDPAHAAQDTMANILAVAAPSESPASVGSPPSTSTLGQDATYDPTHAAQDTMANILAATTPSAPPSTAGPPVPGSTLGQYFTYDPAHAAQDTMANILAATTQSEPPATVGPPLISDDPYFNPVMAAQNAVRYLRQIFVPNDGGATTVGPLNRADNPAYAPSSAWRSAMEQTMEKTMLALNPPALLQAGPTMAVNALESASAGVSIPRLYTTPLLQPIFATRA